MTSSQVEAAVEAFEHLAPDEQLEAYLAIEQIWKNQQNNGVESNSPTHETPE
jgi:hypothetical protein